MKTKIIIRKADSSSDVQSILKMYKKLDEYHVELIPHVFKKSNKFRKEEIIKNEIDNNNSGYLVADYQGEIVGFINYKINENYKLPIFKKYKYILIENVIVLPEYRNKNIGTKLIKEIIKIGKKTKLDMSIL
jgi:GNAT superfamily N-acetyltransferase